MDTRRLIIAVAVSVCVFLIWMQVAQVLFPAPTTQPTTQATTGPATQPTTQPTSPAGGETPGTGEQAAGEKVSSTAPAEPAATRATTGVGGEGDLVAVGAITQQEITFGSVEPDGMYPMAVRLTNRGAAVEEVALRGFKKQVGKPEPYPLLDPVSEPDRHETFYSFATARLRVEGVREAVNLDDARWEIDRDACGPGKVVFRVTIRRADTPILEVTKTYTMTEVGPAKEWTHKDVNARRHDVYITYTLRNLTDSPLNTILVQRGPIGIHREDARTDWRGVLPALRRDGEVTIKQKYRRKKLARDKEEDLGKDGDGQVVEWVALANKFFACIVRPVREGAGAITISKATALILSESEKEATSEDMTFELSSPVEVPAAGTAEAKYACYLGPKSKLAFENIKDYASHNYFAVVSKDFYCCAPGPIVRFMMWLIQVLHWPVHNYGLAIILLVLIVRTVLHPITKAGQVNMMKMQKQMSTLQPKMEELKKKYANDKQKLNEETMALYREAGINPASQLLTCLPMALQMPIWAGLWAALSSTVEMRHAPFDGFWIKDLAAPDTLIAFGRELHIPLVSSLTGPIHGFNLLPILLAVTMYLQQKLMPRAQPAGATQSGDQMAQQQRMMSFMTIFFGFVLYNAPSGLNLYIMSSNVFGIIEQKRIRKHIQELEAREESAPPGSGRTRIKKPRFWRWLERQAEEARQIRSEKVKKKR
jgi:YidC/Oxa1 family membrane protein insertase